MKEKNKRDKFHAKLAFYLSLGFWVPLFNVGLCITSLIIAIMAIKKHSKDPKCFGGIGYAITALILSITSLILSILGLILYLLSDQICLSPICTMKL
jgi:hypothetical protein